MGWGWGEHKLRNEAWFGACKVDERAERRDRHWATSGRGGRVCSRAGPTLWMTAALRGCSGFGAGNRRHFRPVEDCYREVVSYLQVPAERGLGKWSERRRSTAGDGVHRAWRRSAAVQNRARRQVRCELRILAPGSLRSVLRPAQTVGGGGARDSASPRSDGRSHRRTCSALRPDRRQRGEPAPGYDGNEDGDGSHASTRARVSAQTSAWTRARSRASARTSARASARTSAPA
jgi:hypothetical protein